jgi:hypothetical protein
LTSIFHPLFDQYFSSLDGRVRCGASALAAASSPFDQHSIPFDQHSIPFDQREFDRHYRLSLTGIPPRLGEELRDGTLLALPHLRRVGAL